VVASKTYIPEASQLSVDDREKLGFQLLSLVLEFVGYNHEHPEESFIVNPLAYRILLVDYDMWRKTASITQKLYYKQFITFGVQSKFHQFNSRRLFRMREFLFHFLISRTNNMTGIVKRFLDALKAEVFSQDTFPDFMEALTSLVKCNMTAEVFRSLALFITYAYHKPTSPSARTTPKGHSNTLPSRSRTISNGPMRPTVTTLFDGSGKEVNPSILTKRQLGNKVLEMYTDFLCEKNSSTNIKKFARTVTNKVCFTNNSDTLV